MLGTGAYRRCENAPIATDPQAAYVHVPFCRHRCGYCNFAVIAGRDDLVEAYLSALGRELAGLGHPRPVSTLFLGGGTPTHLPPAALARLLDTVTKWFPPSSGGEFSVEANPEDADDERFAILSQYGVNRLSLGVQSFNAAKLMRLERSHDGAVAEAAIARANSFFPSVGLDLIFAAPGETKASWRADIERTLAAATHHVSTYGLTIEKGTPFWAGRRDGQLHEVDEEPQREMFELAIDHLTAAGFEHYEVSNFARPGHRCRHNEAYWRGDEYYAAGPGASRFIAGRRETNHRSTTTYIQRVLADQSPVAEVDELPHDLRVRERLVFALRRMAGVRRDWFQNITGISIDEFAGAEIAKFVALGFLADDGESIRLTRDGLFVSDSLWPHFLSQPDA